MYPETDTDRASLVTGARVATGARGRSSAILALCLVLPACVGTPLSTTVPADSVAPQPEYLARMYAHRTESWGWGSGIYYSPDGTWQAVNSSEQSLGHGRWFVTTASSVCTEGNWHWRQDFGTTEGETNQTCRMFRVAADGELWSTTETEAGPWFPFSFAGFARGNRIERDFARMVRHLGVDEAG